MPKNYSNCGSCPYNPYNPNNVAVSKSYTNSPCSIDLGSNSNTLLIFQAPGWDEWNANTVSGKQIPIDSRSSHSAAAKMRNSFTRRTQAGVPTNRAMYDITESVQCFPDKNKNGRDKKPRIAAQKVCIQYLMQDIVKKPPYQKIVCFGKLAYSMTLMAIKSISGWTGPTPSLAPHPSGNVSKHTLDGSY